MRRTILVALLGIAALLGASVVLIHWLTVAPPPRASTRTAPVAVVPSPIGVAAAEAPGAPAAESSVPAPAPQAVPLPPAESASERRRRQSVRAVTGMEISFKLDPRITAGLHMGERWVSPPTYVSAQKGTLFTVQARARALDSGGRRIENPAWSPAEPDMVAVSPDQGSQVEITVLRAGESGLTVTAGGVSKTLLVKAAHEAGVFRVNITQ